MAGSDPIMVVGSTTISNVATGTVVSCKRGVPRGPMKVPPAGHGVTANVDGSGPSSSGGLQLTHRQDGSVVAVCGGPSAESVSASVSRGSAYGRVSDLQFTYSREYYARSFKNCSFAVTGDRNGGCDRGVVIASYPLQPQPEIGGPGARFSSKGVALELYRPPADNGRATVKLGNRRLSLWQFNAAGEGPYLPGKKSPPPEQWGAWFRVNGSSYSAIAWVGNNAKKADRATLAALINSVHARGQAPRAPSPKPAPQVTRVLCGGTASSPPCPTMRLWVRLRISSACRSLVIPATSGRGRLARRPLTFVSGTCSYARTSASSRVAS
jgi:hypothetical protein